MLTLYPSHYPYRQWYFSSSCKFHFIFLQSIIYTTNLWPPPTEDFWSWKRRTLSQPSRHSNSDGWVYFLCSGLVMHPYLSDMRTWPSLWYAHLLAFNAFSTSRWQFVNNGLCGTIPDGTFFPMPFIYEIKIDLNYEIYVEPLYASYKTWCNEVQALRAFIWLEWVICMFLRIIRDPDDLISENTDHNSSPDVCFHLPLGFQPRPGRQKRRVDDRHFPF